MHAFLDFLFPPRETELLVRGAEVSDLIALIDGSPHGLLPYRNPLVHACVVEAKYRGNERAWKLLGGVLAHHLTGQTGVLVPVPLSSKRRRERGYNQVEEVCKYAVQDGITLDTSVLVRVRDTAPQTSLNGTARRENMVGAFEAQGVDPTATYIIVDDVRTTGATLHAAALVLPGTTLALSR